MKGKKKTKLPNRAVYYIIGFILSVISIIRRKVHIVYKTRDGRIIEGKKVKLELLSSKPPYIIVGNHHSLYDYVYMVRAFYPRRVNFIIARKLYLASKYNFLLKMARAIPKSLFQPDIQTIRKSFDVLGKGGILALYPEGQIVINGISKDIPESSGKLIRKMAKPVFAVRTSGAYFCDSTWRKKLMHGVIEVEVSLALTADEIKQMTADEIDEAIAKAIYVDNFADQEKTGHLYKGRSRAEGLENILYHCPNCNCEFTLATKKHLIWCTNCGVKAEQTESVHLDWKDGAKQYYSHIGHWYNDQRKLAEALHQADEPFPFEVPVQMQVLAQDAVTLGENNNIAIHKTRGIEVAGTGTLILSKDGYRYRGSIFGTQSELTFDPLKLRYIPYTPGSNFQVYMHDVMFAFYPKNPRHCAKVALWIETNYAFAAANAQTDSAEKSETATAQN